VDPGPPDAPSPLCGVMLFLFALAIYSWNPGDLRGGWILDDKGTITMNPVIQGQVPWIELWRRDFWGHDQLTDPDSHKSWRPLCSLTYRLNVFGGPEPDPFTFHVVDRILHALVCVAVLYAASLCCLPLGHGVASPGQALPNAVHGHKLPHLVLGFPATGLVAALLFAAHPIHVEAVSNSTGRAEVLCALFYLFGFICYGDGGRRGWAVTPVACMLLCCLASMLCKEHGVTLPLACAVFDAFLLTATSVPELIGWLRAGVFSRAGPSATEPSAQERRRHAACGQFAVRIMLSIVGMVGLLVWRLRMNGGNPPDFACEQNPAACHGSRWVRFLSYAFLWCFNAWLLIFPNALSPDWSGPSIPLVESIADHRIPAICLLVVALALLLLHTLAAAWAPAPPPNPVYPLPASRRHILTAAYFTLIAFILSSNLFTYVGFVVADRTLYLPSFGFCLLLSLLLAWLAAWTSPRPNAGAEEESNVGPAGSQEAGRSPRALSYLVLALGVGVTSMYLPKQQAQSHRWSDPVLLWGEAYRVNPNSCINGNEYGMSLCNAGRPRDAFPVLWESHRRELAHGYFSDSIRQRQEGSEARWSRLTTIMQTRFKLVTALGNAGECAKANPLIEEGLEVIEAELKQALSHEQGGAGQGERSPSRSLQDCKAYLLVARARCAPDLGIMQHYAAEAYRTRPQMPYVINVAQEIMQLVHGAAQQTGLPPEHIGVQREAGPGKQTAELSYFVLPRQQHQRSAPGGAGW